MLTVFHLMRKSQQKKTQNDGVHIRKKEVIGSTDLIFNVACIGKGFTNLSVLEWTAKDRQKK